MCYVKTVTHREMRNASGEILRAVAAGETYLVTNGGQAAAVISPAGTEPLDRLRAQGQTRDARRPIADLATIRRRESKHTSADLVADARGPW